MPRKPVLIDHPSELDRLRVIPGLRSPGLGRIRLGAEQGLDPETRNEFEQRLNSHYFACGCDTAALFMGIALVGYVGMAAISNIEVFGLGPWLVGFAVLMVAAALGKVVGRIQADRQFRQVVTELKGKWRVPPRVSEQISNCG